MSTTESVAEAAAATSSASATSTAHYLTTSTALDYELQVTAPPIDATVHQHIAQLRTALSTNPVHTAHPSNQRYCTDALLHKYLRARPQSVDKAAALLNDTLQWRAEYRPELITAGEVEAECTYGKILVKDCDQYGRPLIIMNNEYNKSRDHEGSIRQLVFELELASSRMTPPVEKSAILSYSSQSHTADQPRSHARTRSSPPPTTAARRAVCIY